MSGMLFDTNVLLDIATSDTRGRTLPDVFSKGRADHSAVVRGPVENPTRAEWGSDYCLRGIAVLSNPS